MLQIKKFAVNPFMENTYILYDNVSKDAVIIDPGMYSGMEENSIESFIQSMGLNPSQVWLTHTHLDHIFGLNFVHEKYGLTPLAHILEEPIYSNAMFMAQQYGLTMKSLPPINYNLNVGQKISWNGLCFDVLFTPGHSPGSVCFVIKELNTVISGDVLFYESVGRSDLPGGNHNTLIQSITQNLLSLDDDFIILSGHGPETTIGHERKHNPFLR